MEQISSRGSVTVGSSIDSGCTREELNLPQDAGSAGEDSTGSEGCSGTEVSDTMYSTGVSEGVAWGKRCQAYRALQIYMNG